MSDDLNDGSTTDGSISILGDHDMNQGRFDSDDLSTHTPSPQPLQMWMRCTPIDIKKSSDQSRLYRSMYRKRSREQNRFQSTSSDMMELSSSQSPDLADEIFGYLERLNNFLSSIYMLQVILLFLTAGSVAFLAIIYSRYSACKLEVKDLEQKLYSTKMDKMQIEGNLARCEYLYEMELDKTTSTEFKLATDNDDKILPAVHIQTNCQTNDLNGECEIQPTRLSENYAKDADIKLQTVWMGEGDDLLASKKPYKSKDNVIPDCNDESSLFSEYNREYCEMQKKQTHEHRDQQKVYATHYSYKVIDDRECNPNKIDFSLGIEHAKKILRETNCDDDGTMKYLQKAYENYQTKLNDNQTKTHKEFHKKIDKTNEKWEKSQKFNNSIIKVDKHDGHSTEERIDRRERKDRRDKKHQKEKESDKENKRKIDRKDAKKYQPEKEKETNKRNKNDRKRDMVKVYDQRQHD